MTTPKSTTTADELADLLDVLDAQDDTLPENAVAVAHSMATADIAGRQAAPALQAPPLTQLPVPSEIVGLPSLRQQRRNARADLVVEALHGSRECVALIRDAFAGKVADFDDAVKALPILHRVIEHVEKIEAARNVRPALPTLHIEFKGLGFVVHPAPEAEAAPRLLDTD